VPGLMIHLVRSPFRQINSAQRGEFRAVGLRAQGAVSEALASPPRPAPSGVAALREQRFSRG
jgi:hypothetical protein